MLEGSHDAVTRRHSRSDVQRSGSDVIPLHDVSPENGATSIFYKVSFLVLLERLNKLEEELEISPLAPGRFHKRVPPVWWGLTEKIMTTWDVI